MKRFVTYLYVYEEGVKRNNVGFARVSCLDDINRMDVCVRNLGRYNGAVDVYVLVESNGGVEGVSLGEVKISRGFGNGLFEFAEENVIGIRMGIDDSHFVASCWREDKAEAVIGNFNVRKMREADELCISEFMGTISKEITEKEITDKEITDKDKTAKERSNTNDKNIINDNDSKKSIGDIKYKKIILSDLKKLPRKNWHLSNNSFLLHGFYGYKYLIIKSVLTEAGEQFYIGVPGVFLEPEKIVAQLFGFDEFEPHDNEIPQDAPEGKFGYWLCKLDMGL